MILDVATKKKADPIKKAALSSRLRPLRDASGLTQDVLAMRAGVPRRSIQNAESGASNLNGDYLVSLAEILNVSVDDLVKEKSQISKNAETEKKPSHEELLVAIFKESLDLDNNALSTVLAVIRSKSADAQSKLVSSFKNRK